MPCRALFLCTVSILVCINYKHIFLREKDTYTCQNCEWKPIYLNNNLTIANEQVNFDEKINEQIIDERTFKLWMKL